MYLSMIITYNPHRKSPSCRNWWPTSLFTCHSNPRKWYRGKWWTRSKCFWTKKEKVQS